MDDQFIHRFSVIICLITLFAFSCAETGTPRNAELLVKDKQGNWTLNVRKSQLKTVQVNNQPKPIKNVIDVESFDFLSRFEEDATKISNRYYLVNPSGSYFKDKNNLYFLTGENPKVLSLITTVDKYELLGGMYIKVGSEIFWNGRKVENVDVESFNVMHVPRAKSEWRASVGLDKTHLYMGGQLMTEKTFNGLYWDVEDELRAFYFPKK